MSELCMITLCRKNCSSEPRGEQGVGAAQWRTLRPTGRLLGRHECPAAVYLDRRVDNPFIFEWEREALSNGLRRPSQVEGGEQH